MLRAVCCVLLHCRALAPELGLEGMEGEFPAVLCIVGLKMDPSAWHRQCMRLVQYVPMQAQQLSVTDASGQPVTDTLTGNDRQELPHVALRKASGRLWGRPAEPARLSKRSWASVCVHRGGRVCQRQPLPMGMADQRQGRHRLSEAEMAATSPSSSSDGQSTPAALGLGRWS